jgi:hypothetical protein
MTDNLHTSKWSTRSQKHQNIRKPNPDKDIPNHVPYIEWSLGYLKTKWDNCWYQIPASPDLPSIWYWPWNMCIASIMQTWYLCLFHTQVYCIVCIFPHVTQKCVVLTLSIPRYHLKRLERIKMTLQNPHRLTNRWFSMTIAVLSKYLSCLADVDNVSDLSNICRTYIFEVCRLSVIQLIRS